MSTQTMTPPNTSGGRSPCHCHEETPSRPCCCNLVCLDRPNYFRGHLLTDGDLSLQQRYVIEKNKLYHRGLDGYGVVCGLKLTCDPECRGNILIHDGFAIDDCGNDLVVCETATFDVIAALTRKQLLLTEPPDDDCEPPRRRPRCDIDQCFYITICYDEQEAEYETPFQSSCASGPKDCLPTRIRERVRFDVTDKLPPQPAYLAGLEQRLKDCFSIHCDGPIGRIMKDYLDELRSLVAGRKRGEHEREPAEKRDGDPEGRQQEIRRREWMDPCELFCALRAHFLHQLEVKPDEYNCGLFDDVSRLRCPEDYDQEDDACRGETSDAFRRLLVYMQHYQFDCAFGDLVFSCPEPCEAHCLVLGMVEIRGGKLTRVCNTPRHYLWAPANVVPVLMHSILTGEFASAGHKGGHGQADRCCPEYPKFKPEELLNEFEYSECGRYMAATSAVRAFESVRQSLHAAFDFTDSGAISRVLFERAASSIFETRARASEDQKKVLGINVSESTEPATALGVLNPLQALVAESLLRPEASVRGYRRDGRIHTVLPDYFAEISPEPHKGASSVDQEQTIRELRDTLDTLLRRVAELEKSGAADPKTKPSRQRPADRG